MDQRYLNDGKGTSLFILFSLYIAETQSFLLENSDAQLDTESFAVYGWCVRFL